MSQTAELNKRFWGLVKQGDAGMAKVGAKGTLFIQRKLRENAYSRILVKPDPITQAECVPSDTDDSFYYLEEIEPDTIAQGAVTFRSEPEKMWYRGKKMKIFFRTLTSKEFIKPEQELMGWKMPITRIIEQNTVKDIQESEDKMFMDKVHAGLFLATRARFNTLMADGAITLGVTTANFNTENEFVSYLFLRYKRAAAWTAISPTILNPADAEWSNVILSEESKLSRTVLADAEKITLGRELRPRVYLMHEMTFADTTGWTLNDLGLEITSEVVKEGYRYRRLVGFDIVTTIRNRPDICPPGVIYTFPDQQFFGRFLVLEPLVFSIRKPDHRKISMMCYETIAMGFANIHGLGAVVLSGRSIPLQVILQTSTGGYTTSGTLIVWNDYNRATIPTVVV